MASFWQQFCSALLLYLLLLVTLLPLQQGLAQSNQDPESDQSLLEKTGSDVSESGSGIEATTPAPLDASYIGEPASTVTLYCSKDAQQGQYICPELDIDPDTQQPRDCNSDTGRAPIRCIALPGIECKETGNRTFTRDVECKWTNGYEFDTALLLSVFLGMLGADRFYLGYPAIGLLKFSTLGFFFLGHLLDIILLAGGVVGPADGSHFVVSYFGPAVNIISLDENTVRKPQPDWY